MAKTITPSELPAFLLKRQKTQTATAFAASLSVSRQAYNKLVTGAGAPSLDILDRVGLEPVLRSSGQSKLITIDALGAFLLRQQGEDSDTNRATELRLSRQHYCWLLTANTLPKKDTLAKLGLTLLYRVKSK